MNIKKYRLKNTKQYLITNLESFSTQDEFLDEIASKIKAGFDIIELDGQNTTAKKTIEYGKKLRELCSIYNVLLIIRSRADIAHILGADGIHLDENDIDVKSAQHILGHQCIIGYHFAKNENNENLNNLDIDYITIFSNKEAEEIKINHQYDTNTTIYFSIQKNNNDQNKFTILKKLYN